MSWRRIKLRFARGVEVTFADRGRALRQILEWAEKGTDKPVVVYGPEGCGKTALLRQAFEVLESYDYTVVYVSPLEEEEDEWRLRISAYARDIVRDLTALALGERGATLVDLALKLISTLSKHKKLVALLADDIFQAIGLDRAEIYVKRLSNLVEYPPERLEKAVIIVGSSEGVTKTRVGRHSWADIYMMWNMAKEGFRELYEQIPGGKPTFDEIWMWSGGNPRVLRDLYLYNWNIEKAIEKLISGRGLKKFVERLAETQLKILVESLGDPDALHRRLREARTREGKREVVELIDKLVELNLIVEDVSIRSDYLWVDEPPVTDRGIGVGDEAAWQSPIHREAVKMALEGR